MTPEEEQKSGRDAYWRAREASDALREGGDSSDSGADSTSADDGVPPTPAAEPDTAWSPFAQSSPGVQTSAPQAPAMTDDAKARKLAALDEAKRLAYAPVGDQNAGKELAAAQGRDREQRSKDAFTEALQAWLQRRPQRVTPPTEAADLEKRQALDQSSALKQRGQQLSVQEQIAKALTDKEPPAITPYQTEELRLRKEGVDRTAEQRKAGLADRKRTMLALYPDHKAEIDALADLGDAQTLQAALEGRLGRADTQTHQDEARKQSEQFQLWLEQWKQSNKPPTAEQLTQLDSLEKSEGVINEFEKSLGDVSSSAGKVGASFPKVAGAMGAPGASFQAARKGAATQLARGLEGGTAKPGNTEMIEQMLPEAADTDEVKAQKLAKVRSYMKANREAFMRAAQQGGTHLQPIAPRTPTQRPPGVPETAKFNPKTGNWVWRREDGVPVAVPAQ